MALAVGEAAPDFELKNQDNEAVKLSDFQGDKAVALVFVPFAFSGVCIGEFCELSNDIADFQCDFLIVVRVTGIIHHDFTIEGAGCRKTKDGIGTELFEILVSELS